jgi:hypothetical protein
MYDYGEIVRFYDGDGHLYYTFYEPEHHGYAYGDHRWKTGIHGTAKAGGEACGTLTAAGKAIATACVDIS